MSISPSFAREVLACAALAFILWAACVGVGYRILPGRARPPADPDDGTDASGSSETAEPAAQNADGPVEPASWRQPGVAACVGLGVLLFLGGIGVAIEIPWQLIVIPFLVVGLGLVLWDVSRVDTSRLRSVWIIGCLGIAALGLVAVVEAVAGLRFPLNVCDDMRAYLPLARRLIDTNGLVDPWNARRLQNLGGFTYLQALPVSVFGNAGIGVIETVVAAVFLGGLFVANGFRSTWARLLSVAFILAIPFLWVPRANTTGVLMGGPLIVAVLACTVELRKALRGSDRSAAIRWAIAGALVTASVTSVRPNLGVLAAAVLGVGALAAVGSSWLARFRALGVAAATTVVAILPWSVASWQTVNTPLYPLFTGNQNITASAREPANNFHDLAEQAWMLMRTGPYLWVAVFVLVVALVVWKVLPDPPIVAIAAALTIAFVVAFAFNEYSAAREAFVRYVAPASEGLAVFFLYEAVRGADVRMRRGASARSVRWLAPAAVGAAIALAAIGYSTLAIKYPINFSGIQFIDKAARNQWKPPTSNAVSTPALRRAYRRAFAGVDPNRTIVAVDRPYLIDLDRYDVPNMDLPGFTAPDGTFPFFSGPAAKVERLRDAGYDTLVVTAPTRELCLNPDILRQQVERQLRAYAASGRHYLDWEDDITAIAADAPGAIRQVGPLLVIDLPKAQQELAAGNGS